MSQPPLLGMFCNNDGNKAHKANGRPNAIANTIIVMIGVQTSPDVDLMRTVPTIGPVHAKDTRTSVNAMKNTPPRPLLLLVLLSVLLTHEFGNVSSNAPKNEAANTMNTTKNKIFVTHDVEIQLKMSAVTLSPPKIQVIMMIAAIGNVYKATMNT